MGSVQDAADILRLNRATVYRALQDTGEVIPGVRGFKVRSKWRVNLDLLVATLRADVAPDEVAS
jgi:hypothetical protein